MVLSLTMLCYYVGMRFCIKWNWNVYINSIYAIRGTQNNTSKARTNEHHTQTAKKNIVYINAKNNIINGSIVVYVWMCIDS